MTTNPTAPAPLWRCPICGAATTDQGRRLMGPLCWLCCGRLYRDDEQSEDNPDGVALCRACGAPMEDGYPGRAFCYNGPHRLEDYDGGQP